MRFILSLLAFCLYLFSTEPLFAQFQRQMPDVPDIELAQKVQFSSEIVTGKVIAIEDDLVAALPYVDAPNPIGYQIALIQIDQKLLGLKDLTHVRVGWEIATETNNLEGKRLRRGRGPFRKLRFAQPIQPMNSLQLNLEGCFFLQKHVDGEFYTLLPSARILDPWSSSYKADLKTIQKRVEYISNPLASLNLKNASERHLAAMTILMKYRFKASSKSIESPIPSVLSQRLLEVMSEMRYGETEPTGASLAEMYVLLGLSEQDHWAQPSLDSDIAEVDYDQLMDKAFHKWIETNKKKYRIKRYEN